MHKIILVILLAVMSSSAMAEWVEVGTSGNYETIIYADPTTIRKSGNKVKMWVLFDHNSVKETAGDKYLSEKTQMEYDCKEEQERLLFFSWHSENMGRGDVVYSANATNKDWRPVAPESAGKVFWQLACEK